MDIFRSHRRAAIYSNFIWAVLLAEMLAVAWLQRPWHDSDTPLYLELAHNIAHGYFGSATIAGMEPDGLRSPGYPLFLAPFSIMPVAGEALAVGVQLLLYAASLYLVVRRLCRTQWQRMAFLTIIAVYVFPIFYVAMISAEAVSIFLMTVLAALLARRGRLSPGRSIAIGVTTGALALVRPDMLPLILFAPAIIAAGAWRRDDPAWRRTIGRAALVLVCAAAVLTPYAAWNLATFGKFTPLPVASTIGKSLDIATWEPVLRFEDMGPLREGPSTPDSLRSGLSQSVATIDRDSAAAVLRRPVAERHYPVRTMEIEKDRELREAAFTRIAADPGSYALHVVNGFWRLLNTGRYPPRVPPLARGLLEAISFGVYGLAMIGGAWVVAKPDGSGLSPVPGLLLLIMLAAHAPLHTEARYTASVRLFLVLYAVAGLQHLVRKAAALLPDRGVFTAAGPTPSSPV